MAKKNKDFGQKMIDAYVLTTGMKKQSNKKNGVQVEDDPVASKCGCPCVAYLLGNWENEQDYANLHDEVFIDRMCEGIFIGLMSEINGEPVPTPTPAPRTS